MKSLKLVNDALYRVVKFMMMFLLMAIATLVVVAVVGRMVGFSAPWSEELSIYCFSWLSYFGAAVVLRNGDHINVGSFVNMIKVPAIKKALVVLGQLIILAFCCITVYYAAQMVSTFLTSDLRAVNMDFLKMGIVFLQVPVSFALYALFTLENIMNQFTKKEVAAA